MNEKLVKAMDEISDRHIVHAANLQRLRPRFHLRTAAAVLAVVMLLVLIGPQLLPASASELVSPAVYTPMAFPDFDDREDIEANIAAAERYQAWEDARQAVLEQAHESLRPFWADSFRQFLTPEENTVWSPINTYISLAMLAQTASGSTRQEILDALGASSIETLRSEVKILWETVDLDREDSKRHLANSLWLDQDLRYRLKNLKVLGTDYYASVHRTELEDSAAELQAWINSQTGGLLAEIPPHSTPDDSLAQQVLTLASTVFVMDSWEEPFKPGANTEGVFHTPDADVRCTFMNGTKKRTRYHRGSDFTTVGLSTNRGCVLWLVLPDEDSSVAAVLEQGEYLDGVLSKADTVPRKCIVSMPKFDVTSSLDLSSGLRSLGVREVFSPLGGDFSETLTLSSPIYADKVTQSARITVDETGLQAASATDMLIITKGEEPEPITFTLDRPFLFVLTCQDIPLFAGTVTNP